MQLPDSATIVGLINYGGRVGKFHEAKGKTEDKRVKGERVEKRIDGS